LSISHVDISNYYVAIINSIRTPIIIKIEDIDGEANGGVFINTDIELDYYNSVQMCKAWNKVVNLQNEIENNKIKVKLKKS
jgi:hypothetical protein